MKFFETNQGRYLVLQFRQRLGARCLIDELFFELLDLCAV